MYSCSLITKFWANLTLGKIFTFHGNVSLKKEKYLNQEVVLFLLVFYSSCGKWVAGGAEGRQGSVFDVGGLPPPHTPLRGSAGPLIKHVIKGPLPNQS